jgi:hypothetical protein
MGVKVAFFPAGNRGGKGRAGIPEEESASPTRKILPNFEECGIFLMMLP